MLIHNFIMADTEHGLGFRDPGGRPAIRRFQIEQPRHDLGQG